MFCSTPQVSSASGKVALTPQFEAVLANIYAQVDLDGNGTLSRTEFNLFNWRTSGEEVQDDEWQAWLPYGYSRIFRIVCVWPFGLLDYGSATLRCKI